MSVSELTPATGDPDTPPEFDLDCRYDDPVDPAELTIFPAEPESPTTEWLTADRSTAVGLAEIR